MTRCTDHVLFRSLFVEDQVLVEKQKGLQRKVCAKELEKSTDEAAVVESKRKQDAKAGKVRIEEEDDRGAEAKDEAGKKPALVQFVIWSQEEVDVDHREESNEKDSESSDIKVENSKSQMGFWVEEAEEKTVEETKMQVEEEKLDLNVGAKTDIRALFDSDSDSDPDL